MSERTWVVIFRSGPNKTVTAERMENSGGRIVFSNGATVVRSFAADEVVGVDVKT